MCTGNISCTPPLLGNGTSKNNMCIIFKFEWSQYRKEGRHYNEPTYSMYTDVHDF